MRVRGAITTRSDRASEPIFTGEMSCCLKADDRMSPFRMSQDGSRPRGVRQHQRIGNQVSVPPFMSGTSKVLPSGMSEMSAADRNLSDRSLGGSLSETSS